MMTTPPPATTRPAAADARSAPPTAIEVRGLVCRYGSFDAVRALDLTVAEGELFALLGTNGAGKTTTLETLQGHRAAEAGSVQVLGQDPLRARRHLAAEVGVVLQRSGVPEELTAVELLRVWRRLHPRGTRRREPDPLARVGLEHRATVPCRQLSGGELRRLDLALAISTAPRLLFLDEPTTGMDPQAREATWELLRDLRRSGTTMVLTTHYLEEAEALADRIAIMHEGRIVADGTRAELAASQAARIEAELPRNGDLTLPDLVGEVTLDDTRHGRALEIATTDLQEDLTRLLTWARDHRIELTGLRATDASLAQVFHDHTTAPGGDR